MDCRVKLGNDDGFGHEPRRAIKHSGDWTSNALPHPEHLRYKLRINLGQLGRDRSPQDAQRLGGGRGRDWHVRRLVETEAGVLGDLGGRMPGRPAPEREAPPPSVEAQTAAT